jgi:hypothetical protein
MKKCDFKGIFFIGKRYMNKVIFIGKIFFFIGKIYDDVF